VIDLYPFKQDFSTERARVLDRSPFTNIVKTEDMPASDQPHSIISKWGDTNAATAIFGLAVMWFRDYGNINSVQLLVIEADRPEDNAKLFFGRLQQLACSYYNRFRYYELNV